MSRQEQKIAAGIRRLAHKDHELASGTVVAGSVDMETFTCSVLLTGTGDNDTPLQDVLLSAVSGNGNGVILIPADGSNVVVGSMDGPGLYFIAQCSDVVRVVIGSDVAIVINGGNNGGVPLTPGVVDRLNRIERDLNMLKSAFKNWIVAPNDGGGALKAISGTWFGEELEETAAGAIENAKIKQ